MDPDIESCLKLVTVCHQVLIKKELEGEIMLLQGDLDEAEATVNELNNEIPRQQDILEQVLGSLA